MNEGRSPKQGCEECWQDGGWDWVGGQERGVQPRPQQRLAQLPPPERFPVAIKAPFVSAWSWSWSPSLSRRDWEGRGRRQSAGFFFPGGGLPASCLPPLPACLFSLPLPVSGFSLSLCLLACVLFSHLAWVYESLFQFILSRTLLLPVTTCPQFLQVTYCGAVSSLPVGYCHQSQRTNRARSSVP